MNKVQVDRNQNNEGVSNVVTGGEGSNQHEQVIVNTGNEARSQAGQSDDASKSTGQQPSVINDAPSQLEPVDAVGLHTDSVARLAGPAVPNADDYFSDMLQGCEMLTFPEIVYQNNQERGESSSSRRAVTPEPNQNADTNARLRSPRSPGDAPAKRAKVSNGKRKAKEIAYESSLHYHASRAELFMTYPEAQWLNGVEAVQQKFKEQGNKKSALFALKATFAEKGYKSVEEVRTLLTEDNKQVKFKDWKRE